MPHSLSALRRMLLAQRYGEGHHRATVTVENLDPRAVAGWLYWKLSQRQLGPVRPGDIRRIKVISDQKAIVITGDPYAVDRLVVLVQELDTSAAGSISLSCIPVETTQPQRLLCQPRPLTLIELPDGSYMDPGDELSVAKLCPVEPDYADEMVVVVNPYVDTGEVEEMVRAGVAKIGDEPRLLERKGLAGAVTFQCEHTMPSGKSGLRLAALVGEHGLITVQVGIRCSGHALDSPLADDGSATVQYVAYPGQTVAVGVIPATGAEGKMTVLLLTADTEDTQARRRAHNLARRVFRRLRKSPAPRDLVPA